MEYHEFHHIVPRCVGGTDMKSNIVALTPREHFLCHWLLTKMYPRGEARRLLKFAFFALAYLRNGKRTIRLCSYQYDIIRSMMVACRPHRRKGWRMTEEQKAKLRGPKTPEARAHMSEAQRRRVAREDRRGVRNAGFKGFYHTPWGKFESCPAAWKARGSHDIQLSTLYRWFAEPNHVFSTARRGGRKFQFPPGWIGKTTAEVGFFLVRADRNKVLNG